MRRRQAGPAPGRSWQVGDQVIHASFGVGEITTFGSGEKVSIAVKFMGMGPKILDPRLAPIEPLASAGDSSSALNLNRNQRAPVPTVCQPIPIFIGYDPQERAATNVLIDSLYQNGSALWRSPLVTPQLEAGSVSPRARSKTEHSLFVHPFPGAYLMGYQGWALFMDCDMLCRPISSSSGISGMTPMAPCAYSMSMCLGDREVPRRGAERLPEKELEFPNAAQLQPLRKLTPDYVNTATGLELHRFHWLEVTMKSVPSRVTGITWSMCRLRRSHWMLRHAALDPGGPWFREQRTWAALWQRSGSALGMMR